MVVGWYVQAEGMAKGSTGRGRQVVQVVLSGRGRRTGLKVRGQERQKVGEGSRVGCRSSHLLPEGGVVGRDPPRRQAEKVQIRWQERRMVGR